MPSKRKKDAPFSPRPVDAKLELTFRCNLLVYMASLSDKGLQNQALFNDCRHIVTGGFEIMQGVAGGSYKSPQWTFVTCGQRYEVI